MLGSDFVKVYHDAVPADLCDDLIKLHSMLHTQGLTQIGQVMGGYSPYTKISEGVQVDDGPKELLDRTNAVLEDLRARYFRELGLSVGDAMSIKTIRPQVQRYPKNTGFYREHIDVSPRVLKRTVSFVVYLNDVEEGGETRFPQQGVAAKPKKGRAVIFPPFWMFPHEGTIPVTDDKYILISIHEVEEEHDAGS